MIRALAGWMLVQPLAMRTSNELLRLGRVHSIGELPDAEMQRKIPFRPGDRVAWIDGRAEVHALNDTLLLVSLNAPLAYEPLDDIVVGNGEPNHAIVEPDEVDEP